MSTITKGCLVYVKQEAIEHVKNLQNPCYYEENAAIEGVLRTRFLANDVLQKGLWWVARVGKKSCQLVEIAGYKIEKELIVLDNSNCFPKTCFVPTEFIEFAHPALSELEVKNNKRDIRSLLTKYYFLKAELKENRLYKAERRTMYQSGRSFREDYIVIKADSHQLTFRPLNSKEPVMFYILTLEEVDLVPLSTEELLTCGNQKAREYAKEVFVNQDAFFPTKVACRELIEKVAACLNRELKLATQSVRRITSLQGLFSSKMKKGGKSRTYLMEEMQQLKEKYQLEEALLNLQNKSEQLLTEFYSKLNAVQDLDAIKEAGEESNGS